MNTWQQLLCVKVGAKGLDFLWKIKHAYYFNLMYGSENLLRIMLAMFLSVSRSLNMDKKIGRIGIQFLMIAQ